MLDFLTIATRVKKPGLVEAYPEFEIKKSKDLMIRGGDFYAIWVEERGLWSTDEDDVVQLVDRELSKYREANKDKVEGVLKCAYMRTASSGMIDSWHKYCQKQMRDNFHMLDENLIFSNTKVNKKDYASKRLNYPLEPGDYSGWDKLISTLYSESERHKIEWAIGAIVSGESKELQKFMVLYGSAGTGKSTILNIIQKLFDGYYSVFDAKALGSSSSQFALEAFKKNPLVAIQHDGDLSKIEDNTRLNSVVSHELMSVNEKFKSSYENRFKCFLFMGTNKPVKITDAKSGLIRRLIDVTPSGNKLPTREYNSIMKKIDFELGAIASHCLDVYTADPGYYDNYMPMLMMGASNDFYNYILDSFSVFKREDSTTLKAAWEMYKVYCEDAKVPYPLAQRGFKEELKNYFMDYKERFTLPDGTRTRSYYSGFKWDQFDGEDDEIESSSVTKVADSLKQKGKKSDSHIWIDLKEQKSVFDEECANCLAQYANNKEIPSKKWEKVKTTLSELDTRKLHYVKVPENHIVIDFDLKNEKGEKDYDLNAAATASWPPTYAELSKGGSGIHLHYLYSGDPSRLSMVFDDNIEVKVFTGLSSLRRKLTKCNDLPIATISSGLPLKGDDKLLNWDGIKNEKMLRTMIKRNLNKEYHAATAPSINYIHALLEDAYARGIGYDVSDMKNAVIAFAAGSTNQADKCLKMVNDMKFKSAEPSSPVESTDDTLIFYDVEVMKNLFVVCWKAAGEGKPVVKMINPTPAEIGELVKFKLIGFNNRRYDNHILYARLIGYTNEQLYDLSQRIINSKKGDRNSGLFGEAYNLSYTDIYDFASAANKKSLKKWEIELGIHHQELGLPWDQPVPEELWETVADYCVNDVTATEALFNHLQADWTARQILADLAGMTVNDTTNSLTTKIIFGNNRKPQNEFCYRDMSKPVSELNKDVEDFLKEACPNMMADTFGDEHSKLPYFPGYKYEAGKSTYRGIEVGEGGFVAAQVGIHTNVALLDIASMHPHSAIAECLFGPRYTRAFRDIVEGRVSIKHEAWDVVNEMLDGKLRPYVQKVINGELTSGQLADALKTAINSVYGLTSASFENPFRDPRNRDNIVAKRGALTMIDLMFEVQKRGFTVAHIKTDSIKIPNATPEIIKFVMDFGERRGYTFEHEATYEKMCLVNDAVYIAKYASVEWTENAYGYVPTKQKKKAGHWDATGKQFAVPYVFKKLFSKEDIEFNDMCETMSVATSLYLDMNEDLPDVSEEEKQLEKLLKELSDISKLSDPMTKECQEFERLEKIISDGHRYKFVGKVGSFCPIKPGCGGGELLREGTDKNGNVKYSAATGSKGYRWLESEMVKVLEKENDIDRSYYDKLVDDAADTISKYGDFNWFVSDDPYIETPNSMNADMHPVEQPFDTVADDNDLPWYTDDEAELFMKR